MRTTLPNPVDGSDVFETHVLQSCVKLVVGRQEMFPSSFPCPRRFGPRLFDIAKRLHLTSRTAWPSTIASHHPTSPPLHFNAIKCPMQIYWPALRGKFRPRVKLSTHAHSTNRLTDGAHFLRRAADARALADQQIPSQPHAETRSARRRPECHCGFVRRLTLRARARE